MSTNLKPKVKFVYAENVYMDLKRILVMVKKSKKKTGYCPDEDVH